MKLYARWSEGHLFGFIKQIHLHQLQPRSPNWAQISSRKFQGKMDDLRLFDRGLSPDEISQLYGNGAGDTSESLGRIIPARSQWNSSNKKAFDFESDDQNYTLPVRIRHGASFVDTNVTSP